MSCEQFREIKFREDTRAIIDRANGFIDEYGGQRLTLRQVYYRFIATDGFPAGWIDAAYNARNGLPADTKNTEKNYKRLGSILNDARYGGLVDWNIIEDRGREPVEPQEWETLEALVETAFRAFRLPRWRGQSHYCELWVEKLALAGVLQPLASRHHITLMVNRGYSSASAMKVSAERLRAAEDNGKQTIVFYLGDHDPSGEDMVRDIADRLHEFGSSVTVEKLALTMEQIRQYNPPPNPTKVTDARAKAYIAKYGQHSWELDALPPDVLTGLVDAAMQRVIDQRALRAVLRDEEAARKRIRRAIGGQ